MKVPFINLKAQYASIRDEIAQSLDLVLESQQFILGNQVAEFEAEVCGYTGAKHVGNELFLQSFLDWISKCPNFGK